MLFQANYETSWFYIALERYFLIIYSPQCFIKLKLQYFLCIGVFNTVFLIMDHLISNRLSFFSLKELQSKHLHWLFLFPVLFFSCLGGKGRSCRSFWWTLFYSANAFFIIILTSHSSWVKRSKLDCLRCQTDLLRGHWQEEQAELFFGHFVYRSYGHLATNKVSTS